MRANPFLWDAEKKIFTPGSSAPPVVELPFGNVGLMICYDLEFPEWVRLTALSGADLIAVPVSWAASGSPAPPGERSGEVVAAQRNDLFTDRRPDLYARLSDSA